MPENLSASEGSLAEDKSASLEFQQAKEEGLLEQARRSRQEPEKYDSLGRERVTPVEFTGIYKSGTIAEKINYRLDHGQSPLVLFSDIDNTFYHKELPEEASRLSQILEDNHWGLVFVTGNEADILSRRPELPKADILVGAVGTDIAVRQKDGSYAKDEEYQKLLGEGWDRPQIIEESRGIISENPQIRFQDKTDPDKNPDVKEPFKVSFWVNGDIKDADPILEKFRARLGSDIQIIAVIDIGNPITSYNIDILPKNAGKAFAVRYLTNKLGVFGPVAGDSENDIDMLVESGQPAILVGNATDRTRQSVLLATKDEKVASFGTKVQKLPSGARITIGRKGAEDAARGLTSILKKGDINPEDARWFVASLYRLSKKGEEK